MLIAMTTMYGYNRSQYLYEAGITQALPIGSPRQRHLKYLEVVNKFGYATAINQKNTLCLSEKSIHIKIPDLVN